MRAIFAITVAYFILSSLTLASDLPSRKSGRWQIKTSGQDMPMPVISEQCVDSKTDQLLNQQISQFPGNSRSQCKAQSVRHEGSRIIAESVCTMGDTTTKNTTVFTGDFTRHYRAEITNTYTPPLYGKKTDRISIEAKWLGACKPGQKPGDITFAGQTSNLPNTLQNVDPKEMEEFLKEASKRLPPEYRGRMLQTP